MSPDKAISERDVLKGQLQFHRLLNLILSLTLFISLAILGLVIFREKTLIVPPEVRQSYRLGAGYVSNEYLVDIASYVLQTILTVTPERVDHGNTVILKMTAPSGYAALKTALSAAALRMKKERVTTIWIPNKEEVNQARRQVKISGKLKTYIADQLTSEREKTFLVEFVLTISGRIYVSKVEEVVANRNERNHF